MIKLRYINISIICIFIVFFIFYFAFIYKSKTITTEEKYYQISYIKEKQDLPNGNYHYFFIFERDGSIYGRTTQSENIPWDSIAAKKCQLVKYYHIEKTLVFNPINIKFNQKVKNIYNNSEDKIIYKPDN